jgi:hypothetical protein
VAAVGAIEVTLTDTVHDPGVPPDCAGTVPPFKEIVEEPGAAVTVLLGPQVFVTEGGLATSISGGIASVQEALVNGNEFGLYMLIRRKVIPPEEIKLGEKLLFISAVADT